MRYKQPKFDFRSYFLQILMKNGSFWSKHFKHIPKTLLTVGSGVSSGKTYTGRSMSMTQLVVFGDIMNVLIGIIHSHLPMKATNDSQLNVVGAEFKRKTYFSKINALMLRI